MLILQPQKPHSAHGLLRIGIRAPNNDQFGNGARPKEDHRYRDANQAVPRYPRDCQGDSSPYGRFTQPHVAIALPKKGALSDQGRATGSL